VVSEDRGGCRERGQRGAVPFAGGRILRSYIGAVLAKLATDPGATEPAT